MILHERNNKWTIKWAAAKYLGTHATNNVAEYTALLQGLQVLHNEQSLQHLHLEIFTDSQLIYKYLTMQSRPRNISMKRMTYKTMQLLATCQRWSIQHTRRTGNTAADALANYAMDDKKSSAQRHQLGSTRWTTISKLTERDQQHDKEPHRAQRTIVTTLQRTLDQLTTQQPAAQRQTASRLRASHQPPPGHVTQAVQAANWGTRHGWRQHLATF